MPSTDPSNKPSKRGSRKQKKALDTKKPPHVKEETSTPVKLQMASPASILTPLSFSGVEPEHKRPIQKPPSFDGKSRWEPYIAQFEIVAGMNQWNDEQKESYLATSLKGVCIDSPWKSRNRNETGLQDISCSVQE